MAEAVLVAFGVECESVAEMLHLLRPPFGAALDDGQGFPELRIAQLAKGFYFELLRKHGVDVFRHALPPVLKRGIQKLRLLLVVDERIVDFRRRRDRRLHRLRTFLNGLVLRGYALLARGYVFDRFLQYAGKIRRLGCGLQRLWSEIESLGRRSGSFLDRVPDSAQCDELVEHGGFRNSQIRK